MPFASGGSVPFFLTSSEQTASFTVQGSDKRTRKLYTVQLNSTVCGDLGS